MANTMKLRFMMMGDSYDATAEFARRIRLANRRSHRRCTRRYYQTAGRRTDVTSSCLVVHNGKHLGTVASHDNVRLADQDKLWLIGQVAGG